MAHPGRTCHLGRYLNREKTIDTLTSKQRAHLRKLAHHLDAVLQVGADGATDAVLDAVEDVLSNRELIKVKVLKGSADSPDAAADRIGGLEDVHVVQLIGRTLVLYRPHPDEPEIRLPG